MQAADDNHGQAAISILSLLVSVAIILLVLRFFVFPPGQASGPEGAGSMPGQVLERGKDSVCQQNLAGDRQVIEAARLSNMAEGSGYPASLDELQEYKNMPENFTCPVGKVKYNYDPATGKLSCPHPGHLNY